MRTAIILVAAVFFATFSIVEADEISEFLHKDTAAVLTFEDTALLARVVRSVPIWSSKDFEKAIEEISGTTNENLADTIANIQDQISNTSRFIADCESIHIILDRIADKGEWQWVLAIERRAGFDEFPQQSFEQKGKDLIGFVSKATKSRRSNPRPLFQISEGEEIKCKFLDNWVFWGSSQCLDGIQRRANNSLGNLRNYNRVVSTKYSQEPLRGECFCVLYANPERFRDFFPKVSDEEWKAWKVTEMTTFVGRGYVVLKEGKWISHCFDGRLVFTEPLSGKALEWSRFLPIRQFPNLPFEVNRAQVTSRDLEKIESDNAEIENRSPSPIAQRTEHQYFFEYTDRFEKSAGLVMECIKNPEAMRLFVQQLAKATSENDPSLDYNRYATQSYEIWRPSLESVNNDALRRIEQRKNSREKRKQLGELVDGESDEFHLAESWKEIKCNVYAITENWYFQGDLFDVERVIENVESEDIQPGSYAKFVKDAIENVRFLGSAACVDYFKLSMPQGKFDEFVELAFLKLPECKTTNVYELREKFWKRKFDPQTEIENERLHIAKCYVLRGFLDMFGENVYLAGIQENHLRIVLYSEFREPN